MLSPAQRAARRSRVGASEVAALWGEHPYVTAADVWDRIVTGAVRAPTGRMIVGSELERPILRILTRWYSIRARPCWRAYVHTDVPLAASPDGYVPPDGLVEVKVTSAWTDATPPPYVVAQVQAQLLLTRRAYCHVAVLRGALLDVGIIEADPLAQARIVDAVARFDAEYLRPRIRPPVPEFTFTYTPRGDTP
jgi:hypothetical protein